MKPESLLGIALELIERVAAPGAYPADARVGRFFRARRYLGSRDRRFLSDVAYAWLRLSFRARAAWRGSLVAGAHAPGAGETPELPDDAGVALLESDLATRAESDEPGPSGERRPGGGDPASNGARATLRLIYILDLVEIARSGCLPWTVAELAEAARALPEGEAARPGWRETIEAALAAEPPALAAPSEPAARLALEGSLPAWIAERLVEHHGEERARALAAALLEPASVDLRVNLRLADRVEARAALERDVGKKVEFTRYSPSGLRLEGRANLTATTASRKGWVEVQDEGSQIAVLCAEPAPGEVVIDACAGGGGKSLAIADRVLSGDAAASGAAQGLIWACDISRARLVELARRARDAGVEDRIRRLHIYPAGPLPDELPPADLVLVDAPCTGLGTLRRNPELKRRHQAEDVRRFAELELSILERFLPLVKPGGRLAYVVCSFLREEGEGVADALERAHPELEPRPSAWARATLPQGCIDGHRIRVDPLLTETDAFFIAVWRRR